MSSDQKDQEVLDVNSGCARKPGAISEDMNEDRGDGSNAPDGSEAMTLANEDKAVGSTTARDAPSHLIAPSQEENSKVGGSQEDVEDASEAKKLANEDTDQGSNTARDPSPDSIAPNEEEDIKVGGSQEEGHACRQPSNRKKKDVSSAEGGGMTKYNDRVPTPQNTEQAIERSKASS